MEFETVFRPSDEGPPKPMGPRVSCAVDGNDHGTGAISGMGTGSPKGEASRENVTRVVAGERACDCELLLLRCFRSAPWCSA